MAFLDDILKKLKGAGDFVGGVAKGAYTAAKENVTPMIRNITEPIRESRSLMQDTRQMAADNNARLLAIRNAASRQEAQRLADQALNPINNITQRANDLQRKYTIDLTTSQGRKNVGRVALDATRGVGYLYGAARLSPKTVLNPLNLGISAATSAYASSKGVPFSEALGYGMGQMPFYSGTARLTNPALNRIARAVPGSKTLTSALTGSILNVGQGLAQDVTQGNKPTATSIGLDALMGAVGGRNQFSDTTSNLRMGKSTMNEVIKAEDMLLHPERYVTVRAHTARNRAAITKIEVDKIRNQAVETIDRIAAKHLPTKVLDQTAGDTKAQIKALIDLNSQNRLTNVSYLTNDTSRGKNVNPSASGEVSKARKPQTLNTERLNLDAEGRQHVASLESQEPKTVLKNKEVELLADETSGRDRVVTKEDTATDLARRLANRQKVVTLENQFKRLRDQGASEEELADLTAQIARASKVARSEGTDAGRTLQAQTILADQMATPMQRVFRLLDTAGVDESQYGREAAKVNWDNANEVVSFYRKYVPPKFGEWLNEYLYTNMLSSPRSWITNVGTNVLQVGTQPVRKVLAGGYDRLLSTITGRERQQFSGEALPFVKRAVSALPNAWKEAKAAFTGKQAITNLDYDRMPTGNKLLQKYSFPSRIMEAGDVFFKNILQSGQEGALEYRAKRTGKALDPDILAKNAKDYALETLFRGELNKKGQGWILNGIDGMTNLILSMRHSKSGLVRTGSKLLIPFVRTPMEILKQGVEYSPLEFVNMIKSKGDTADQLAKATIGSMVMASAGLLAASGNMTWDEPNSTNERAEFYAAGKQKYSIKIGDKWVSYSKLGPLAYPIAMAGAINEALRTKGEDEQALETAGRIIAMTGGFFTDQSYMQSIGDLIEAAQGNEFKQTRILASVPQQLVPMKALLSWVSKMVDPIYRKVNWKDGIPLSIAQSIQRDLPFVSKDLPAYETPFGEDSQRQYPVLNSVSPMTITKENPVENEYYQMQQTKREEKRRQTHLKTQFAQDKATTANLPTDKRLRMADAVFNLSDIRAMPEDSAYRKALKRTKVFTKIDDIMDSEDFSEEEKGKIVESLGISPDEAEYYNVARQVETAKVAYVQEVLQQANGVDPFALLAQMRREVNGKMVLSNGVIDELEDAGMISDSQAKQLKKLKYNNSTGKVEGTSSGSASSKSLKQLASILKTIRQDNEAFGQLSAQMSAPTKRPTALSMVLNQSRTKRKPSASSIDAILAKRRQEARTPLDRIRTLT